MLFHRTVVAFIALILLICFLKRIPPLKRFAYCSRDVLKAHTNELLPSYLTVVSSFVHKLHFYFFSQNCLGYLDKIRCCLFGLLVFLRRSEIQYRCQGEIMHSDWLQIYLFLSKLPINLLCFE